MSKLEVSLEKIEVCEHPNADKLDIIKLIDKDYQCVAKKGEFKTGDEAIYFPIDSIVPEDVLEEIGLNGKLSGKDRNRVKTINLRGETSQGIVVKPTVFFEDKIPDNLTSFFRVEKYEPEPIPCKAGKLLPLPAGVEKYDIENAQANKKIVEMLMNERVIVTEKMEGTNYSITVNEEETYVNQRNYTIKPVENKLHDFWKIAKKENLIEIAEEVKECYNGGQITMRGEYLGPSIQKNIYGFKENMVQFFDIKIDNDYIHPFELICLRNNYGLEFVPILGFDITLKEWLDGKTIVEASNGMSADNPDVLREGIVIKPMKETYVSGFGRLIIKQRSPQYLEKYDT